VKHQLSKSAEPPGGGEAQNKETLETGFEKHQSPSRGDDSETRPDRERGREPGPSAFGSDRWHHREQRES